MSFSSHRSEFPMVLVANKADLETDRVVSYQEGEELAKTLKVCWSNLLLFTCASVFVQCMILLGNGTTCNVMI